MGRPALRELESSFGSPCSQTDLRINNGELSNYASRKVLAKFHTDPAPSVGIFSRHLFAVSLSFARPRKSRARRKDLSLADS